jgi:hypothetical protein
LGRISAPKMESRGIDGELVEIITIKNIAARG